MIFSKMCLIQVLIQVIKWDYFINPSEIKKILDMYPTHLYSIRIFLLSFKYYNKTCEDTSVVKGSHLMFLVAFTENLIGSYKVRKYAVFASEKSSISFGTNVPVCPSKIVFFYLPTQLQKSTPNWETHLNIGICAHLVYKMGWNNSWRSIRFQTRLLKHSYNSNKKKWGNSTCLKSTLCY